MEVLQISASDTYPLRNKLLRPGRPVESCMFKNDDHEQTFHLGAFVDKKLVSVASFYFDNNDTFSEEYQFCLRGMATLPEFRGQGFSSNLLKTAFPIIKSNFCSLLWCNAREESIIFYEKIGFEKSGNKFDIPEVGPHILAFKKI